MGSDRTARRILIIAASLVVVVVAVLVAGCGSDAESGDPGSGNPDSELTLKQAEAPLPAGAAPELVDIRKQANRLIEDGGDTLDAQLAALKSAGIPVVVNKWASWCGPCREEFPDLQSESEKYGDKVAFLGINSNDGPDTANTFLSEFPVPYPSYSDPDQDISSSLDIEREFPSTLFIDSSGEVVYTQRGPFASADDLESDIQQILD